MKKIILSIVAVTLSVLFLSSCGSANKTVLLGSKSAKSYVELGNYEKIEVDSSSDDYKVYYDALYNSDVAQNGLYDQVDEGEVQSGDYVNIDFEGKIDGVAFEGGTSTGYDLLIGSGSFIDGFEEGLIGKKVGETVDLNLTFPANYQSTELAGKDVVFTVKINYRRVPQDIEKAYKALGFESVKKYEEDLNNRCKEFFAVKTFIESCKIKSSPKTDEFNGLVLLVFYDNYLRQSQGVSLASYLKNNGQSVNDFATNILAHLNDSQIETLPEFKEVKNTVLVTYALSEEKGFSADAKATNKKTEYEKCLAEYNSLRSKCSEFLIKNTTIKTGKKK
ncbi:MAG: FKBP-type peptidyl-prolyl cis-trans isomerase [Clostridia bacterium]|nr:FKBP-type peptidyl-prolyl cis-trans isomerase [Clostridia bacterium]